MSNDSLGRETCRFDERFLAFAMPHLVFKHLHGLRSLAVLTPAKRLGADFSSVRVASHKQSPQLIDSSAGAGGLIMPSVVSPRRAVEASGP